jgi:hypothetical protein
MRELAEPRLSFFAKQTEAWWTEKVPFFDVIRERIWVFWRRVLLGSFCANRRLPM